MFYTSKNVMTLLGPTSRLRHSASWRQNKAETGGGPFKPAQILLHKELKISSCSDVGCRIDVVEAPI